MYFSHLFLTCHSLTPTQMWWHCWLMQRNGTQAPSDLTDISWEAPQLELEELQTPCCFVKLLLLLTFGLCLTDRPCRKETLRESHWKPIAGWVAQEGWLGWGEPTGHRMQHDLWLQQNKEGVDILSCGHEWHSQSQAGIAMELKRVTQTTWLCRGRQLACLQRAIKTNPNHLWESWPAPPGIFVPFLQQYLFLNCIVLCTPQCYGSVSHPFHLERNLKKKKSLWFFFFLKVQNSRDIWNPEILKFQ